MFVRIGGGDFIGLGGNNPLPPPGGKQIFVSAASFAKPAIFLIPSEFFNSRGWYSLLSTRRQAFLGVPNYTARVDSRLNVTLGWSRQDAAVEFFAGLKRGAGLRWAHSKPFNPIRLMDIVFDCPNCNQELAVDGAGAGTEIQCPACGETITIPPESTKTPAPENAPPPAVQGGSAINTSAAAKVEMHLKVPLSDKPGKSLIEKPKPPLEAVAKGADKRIRTNTIKHASCIESGHDKFDEKVTEFLSKIGESNVIGIHTISYTHFDVGTQKILNDYGVLVVYRG
jgi:predicted RNA-binding Zn-ribbon protein involved in translation (DUF1610 family)